ncbi:MAG: hypothetical protein EA382_16435 [Spirochaetaceae bacterium]|nr:MAG: hypothetical protein EA382_16435 [Spirochaetaceae bacterium]
MRRAALLLSLTVFLAACRTTEPIWFVATPGYVETRIAASEAAVRSDYDARLLDLQREIDEQRAVSERLASLSELIEAVDASNRELRDLAVRVEEQLAGLPEEIIREIVGALTAHLDARR